MTARKIVILFLSLVMLNCSNDEENSTVAMTGSLEVTVVFQNGTPAPDVLVTILERNETRPTNQEGVAFFDNLEPGLYNIRLTDNGIIFNVEDAVLIENNRTTTITLTTLDEPNPIQENPLNIGIVLEQTYEGLGNQYLFNATGYVSYWGDNGSDMAYVPLNTDPRLFEIDLYQANSGNSIINEVWATHYALITNINFALDAIEQDDFELDDTTTTIGEVQAEFRFLRALLYFNLVKLYGNPILVTSVVDPNDMPPNNQNPNDTYDAIESDLLFAIENLSVTTSNNKATVGAARALLGRVYLTAAGFPLFRQDGYSNALEQLRLLENQYILEENYSDVFSVENEANNSEVIFRIEFNANGDYGAPWGPQGIAAADRFLLAPEFPESYFEDPDIISNPISFPLQVTDARFFQNIAFFSVQNETAVDNTDIGEWRPYKYKKNTLEPAEFGGESFDFPYLRYADVLLMIAEIENELNGPSIEAYNAINSVRRRAFGNQDHDIEPGLNQQAFFSAVLNERKLEFAFEGLRKDDLIRTGQLQSVIENFNQTVEPNLQKEYQDFEYIWPIPQSEINSNPNIVQNPGY